MARGLAPRLAGGGVEMASYDFVACRELRHAWAIGQTRRAADIVTRDLNCLRCGTVRVERFSLDRDGYLTKVGNRYVYPENYALKGTSAPEVARSARVYSVLSRLAG